MSSAIISALRSTRVRLLARVWRRLFSIAPSAIDMECRGFFTEVPGMRSMLETCAGAFLCGYHLALADAGVADLAAMLATTPQHIRGFAYEGAAMGLALLDSVTP